MQIFSRFFLVIFLSIFSVESIAIPVGQISIEQPPEQTSAEKNTPTFENYPATPAPIDQTRVPPNIDMLSHPKAGKYREHLRRAGGPNFAGTYTLVSWYCGEDCLTAAIIDTTTGAVYFPPELAFLESGLKQYEVDSEWAYKNPLNYQLNSKLLIVVGYPTPDGASRKGGGVFYYVWENNQLNLISQTNIKTSKTLP